MSKILDALKGISSFPGTLKDLLIEFEQRIGALESSAVDVAKVGADVVSDVSPTATLAARVASLEQTVADLVQDGGRCEGGNQASGSGRNASGKIEATSFWGFACNSTGTQAM